VEVKDSADFIRIIQEPDSGSLNFRVFEYYPDKTLRFLGAVSSFDPQLVFEGPSKRFYKNGKQEEIVSYKNGIPVGTAFQFHTNGKLHRILEHGDEGIHVRLAWNKSYHYKVKELYDSTGVAIVKDGKGYVKEKDDAFIGEGLYLNGMREGLWKFTRADKAVTSEETFAAGKFLSGKVINSDGSSRTYDKEALTPEFKGGMDGFNRYLSRKIQFPADAMRLGITGKVYVSFVVEADGSISDIKLLNRIYPSLDREALRVIARSPEWIPGQQHGIPVRVVFNVPVSYQFY